MVGSLSRRQNDWRDVSLQPLDFLANPFGRTESASGVGLLDEEVRDATSMGGASSARMLHLHRAFVAGF
jgi:hypothetical protein